MDIGLQRAVDAAGGIRSLARLLGVSHTAILKWERVPDVWILRIEEVTKVPRHKLRQDMFAGYKRKVPEPA